MIDYILIFHMPGIRHSRRIYVSVSTNIRNIITSIQTKICLKTHHGFAGGQADGSWKAGQTT